MQVLINLYIYVNVMTLKYTLKLGLKVCFTNIKTAKIDSSTFKIFEIVLTSFQIKNK